MGNINQDSTYLVKGDLLQDICDAVKSKTGASSVQVAQLPSAIEAIPSGGGGTTVVSRTFQTNGTYTAPSGYSYSPVTVNVPTGKPDYLLQDGDRISNLYFNVRINDQTLQSFFSQLTYTAGMYCDYCYLGLELDALRIPKQGGGYVYAISHRIDNTTEIVYATEAFDSTNIFPTPVPYGGWYRAWVGIDYQTVDFQSINEKLLLILDQIIAKSEAAFGEGYRGDTVSGNAANPFGSYLAEYLAKQPGLNTDIGIGNGTLKAICSILCDTSAITHQQGTEAFGYCYISFPDGSTPYICYNGALVGTTLETSMAFDIKWLVNTTSWTVSLDVANILMGGQVTDISPYASQLTTEAVFLFTT